MFDAVCSLKCAVSAVYILLSVICSLQYVVCSLQSADIIITLVLD